MFVTIQRMSKTQRRPIRLRKEILRSSFLQNATVRVARFPVDDLSDYFYFTCSSIPMMPINPMVGIRIPSNTYFRFRTQNGAGSQLASPLMWLPFPGFQHRVVSMLSEELRCLACPLSLYIITISREQTQNRKSSQLNSANSSYNTFRFIVQNMLKNKMLHIYLVC